MGELRQHMCQQTTHSLAVLVVRVEIAIWDKQAWQKDQQQQSGEKLSKGRTKKESSNVSAEGILPTAGF